MTWLIVQTRRGRRSTWEHVQLEEPWGYTFCSVWTVCVRSLSQQAVFSPRQEEIFHASFAILFSFPVYKK